VASCDVASCDVAGIDFVVRPLPWSKRAMRVREFTRPSVDPSIVALLLLDRTTTQGLTSCQLLCQLNFRPFIPEPTEGISSHNSKIL